MGEIMPLPLKSLPCAVVLVSFAVTAAQAQRVERGVEISGIPALNFDADEGLGYGVILQLYAYDGNAATYRWPVQPTVFLTTEGRRDYTVFFDAPSRPEHAWRITGFAGREQQLATPYYGLGNASPYDSKLETGSTQLLQQIAEGDAFLCSEHLQIGERITGDRFARSHGNHLADTLQGLIPGGWRSDDSDLSGGRRNRQWIPGRGVHVGHAHVRGRGTVTRTARLVSGDAQADDVVTGDE